MAIPVKVLKFLEKSGVKYETIKHRTVYTAYDKAATLKVNLKIIGKTLLLSLDKNPAVILIPANKDLDKNKLKKATKAKKIDFLSERVIKNKLRGVKIGAVPPFGNFWKTGTFVDRSLLKAPKIYINSGDNRWSLKISGSSFKKLIPDLVCGSFSKPKKK